MKEKNKIIANTVWLLSEKTINIIGLIFVTSFVAKYIGPTNFGKLSLATYLFSLVQTVAIWGTDTLCVKRISRNKASGMALLFSLSKLRLSVFFIIAMPVLVYIYMSSDIIAFYFSLAVAISTFIYIQDVYIIANNATYQSKFNVVSNVIGLAISLLVRYFIAYFKLDVIWLSIPIVTINLIPFALRFFLFRYNSRESNIKVSKRVKNEYSRYIFYAGFPLVISSISVAIYFNTSRLMLGAVESVKELGIYSVAITLGSAWSFVNNAFVTSMTPKLYSSNNKDTSMLISAFMGQFIILISFLYFVFFFFVGDYAVSILYGHAYLQAFQVTIPLIFSTMISSLGMPTSRFIVHHEGYGFLGKKTIIVSIVGLLISYLLIHKYGIMGAAYSTLLVEILSLTIMNYFFKHGVVLKMHLKMLDFTLFKKIFQKD